ncbi:MAG TPA: outer membrane beta-barrel protein [Usitatibacter sp.]|nr:outer membrane beta-barrel protein [Usitatibacter sp.]
MRRTQAILTAAALAAALPVAAQQAPMPWYVGVAGGQSRTSDDMVSNFESTIVNAQPTSSSFDSNQGAWKIFGGWRANELFSVEAYWADLGRTHMTVNTLSIDQLPGTFDMTRKVDGFGVDGLVHGHFLPGFSVFARAGAFASRTRADANLSGGLIFINDPTARSRSNTVNETVFHYGVGGQWDFQPNMALRFEWERFDKVGKAFQTGVSGTTGEADTDLVSLGILVRF